MNKGLKVGYIRVSTIEQNTMRQLENITLDKVFTDKCSGKHTNRIQFQIMMNYVREGDHVYVHSMDRMARNVDNLRSIVKTLIEKGVEITFVKECLSFNSKENPMSQFFLTVMGACAELEVSLSREAQREGIALARARGAYTGRKKCLNTEQIEELKKMVHIEGMKKTYLAKKFGISRYTLYNYLKDNK